MKHMTLRLVAFILILNTCLCSSASGQKEFGFRMPHKVKKIQIPFEQHNNLIIIPVTVNDFITLKFILDTGVETAILTEKLYADMMHVNYTRELIIAGPGLADSVEALVANNLTFSLPGRVFGKNMNMLVLKQDYLKLSEYIGEDVHGIIGYDIFSRFIVDINYDEEVITLMDPKKFKQKRKSVAVPLAIRNARPFLRTEVREGGKKIHLDVLIDTGASHAALFDYTYIEDIPLPNETIVTQLGRGIAGVIPGYLGRMDSIKINSFGFGDVLISAPFEGAYNKSIKRGARIGTLGGELLSRFNLTFDYNGGYLYLQKSNRYKDNFEHDMSGMTLNASGAMLDTIKVVSVVQNGPAFQAGIRVGDVVKSVNGKNLYSHSMSHFYNLLQSREGRKIQCKILRDGEKKKISFRLKRAI